VGGGFGGFRKIDELIAVFPIDETEAAAAASYPIAPSRRVLAIVRHQGKNRLKRLHWRQQPRQHPADGPDEP
jgi:hypothetical protein